MTTFERYSWNILSKFYAVDTFSPSLGAHWNQLAFVSEDDTTSLILTLCTDYNDQQDGRKYTVVIEEKESSAAEISYEEDTV